MPQIILYEWEIIFSGSLLHKTPTPCLLRDCKHSCGLSILALFSTVLMSPERGCEAPQLVVAAGPDGGHGRRGGEQGQVPHHPADRQCGYY